MACSVSGLVGAFRIDCFLLWEAAKSAIIAPTYGQPHLFPIFYPFWDQHIAISGGKRFYLNEWRWLGEIQILLQWNS